MKKTIMLTTILMCIALVKLQATTRPETDYYFKHKEVVAAGVETMAANMGILLSNKESFYVSGFLDEGKYCKYHFDEWYAVAKDGVDVPGLKITGKSYKNALDDFLRTHENISLQQAIDEGKIKDGGPMTADMVASSNIAVLYNKRVEDKDQKVIVDSAISMAWQVGRPKDDDQPYTGEHCIVFDAGDHYDVIGSDACFNFFWGYSIPPKQPTQPLQPKLPPIVVKKDTGDYDMSGFTNSGGNSSSVSSASISNSIPISINIIGGFPGTGIGNTGNGNSGNNGNVNDGQSNQRNCCIEKKPRGRWLGYVAAGVGGFGAGYLTKALIGKKPTINNYDYDYNYYLQQAAQGNPNQGSSGGSQTGSSGTDPGDSGGRGNNNGGIQ